MKTNRCVISERERREVSLAAHLERDLTNPSMIDVCYERLYSRLIGLMRMTRDSFVCLYVNRTFSSDVSVYPAAAESGGLNDIPAEEG